MSDKLKELTPVLVSFVQGESPTPNKLENSFDQVSTAMNILERAVGDIWNQSSVTAGPLDLNPNYIANLSRAVGNMSSMNPKSLGGNVIGIINEAVPTGKKLFALAHAPDDPATPAAITFTNPSGVFEVLKVSVAAMTIAGDYFIDTSGLVYTFSETGGSHTVSYDYTTVTDSYSGATYNVIPNPSQDAPGDRCSVATSGSGYIITLPIDTDSGSENHDQQLTLPSDLSILEVDDEIPAGFIYIWDNTENTIIEGFTFEKQATLTTVYAEGNDTLDIGASRYSIITVGSQVTKMMEALRDLILSHDHMDNQTQFIDHTKILGSDAAVAHGTTSAIMGIDDIQTVTNKTLVDPLFFDTGGAGFVTNVIIRVFEGEVAFRNSLDTEYQPLNLNCVPDVLTGKSADQVDGIHASATPAANQLLALDGSLKFPNSVLETGHGNGLDADTLDSQHAPAGTIVGTSDVQVLTNKELTSPKLNSSTVITATGEQVNELVGGAEITLHSHSGFLSSITSGFTVSQTYSSDGTFYLSLPAGKTDVFIACWGAGGGGAYNKDGGGGGGGGGFSGGLYKLATDPSDLTIVVGDGGVKGHGTTGETGETSSVSEDTIGVICSATGGIGGIGSTSNGAGGAGGTGSSVGNSQKAGSISLMQDEALDITSVAPLVKTERTRTGGTGGQGAGQAYEAPGGGAGGYGGNGAVFYGGSGTISDELALLIGHFGFSYAGGNGGGVAGGGNDTQTAGHNPGGGGAGGDRYHYDGTKMRGADGKVIILY